MIKAVVFDVDGTLLDTREYITQAFEYALTKHNLPVPPREHICAQVGPPLNKCYEILAPGFSYELLCDAHREFQKENYHIITAYPHALELLTSFRSLGIKTGLASTRQVTLLPSVEHTGIASLVDCIIDGSHVTKHKPDPEAVLLVLSALKENPEHSIMVGDTIADIGAGKNANTAFTIGITHGFGTRESLAGAHADFIADTLPEIENFIQRNVGTIL
jgi:HAD superfamily hydrolase (TIGR01509 family)